MLDEPLPPTDAAARSPKPATGPLRSQLTQKQGGVMVAVLAAFFGIAFGGPALTSAGQRRRRAQAQIVAQTRHVRTRAHRAGKTARRKLRRLGGGSI